MKFQAVIDLLELLDAGEDEALKALLSAFTPCQPGALRAVWAARKHYGEPPSTREIWEIFQAADFRCKSCGGQHRITIDHIDDNARNSDLKNLQVLCADCNRAKNERGIKNKHHRVRVYRALMKLYKREGVFPTDMQIKAEAQLDDLSGALYLVRFFEARLGKSRELRSYQRRSTRIAKNPVEQKNEA